MAVHIKHSYYEYVNEYLENTINIIEAKGGTVTSEDITNALNSIRKGLLEGSVKLN